MVMGTASDAGKSAIVTGLCRLFARRGVRVAPFKAQNMSNNGAVTPDGLEIGRAQYEQAMAAGAVPEVAMNPILLKPEGDARCQVVVNGKPWKHRTAAAYEDDKEDLRRIVLESLADLCRRFDLVIIEGAGSPAEINLKHRDLVNFFVARAVQAPVLLVSDIDRGGAFAALVGTLALLEPDERALVKGLLLNKFRGDPALLGDGFRMLEEKTGVPVLGMIPFLPRLGLAAEDSVAVDRRAMVQTAPDAVDVAVVRLPRLSNFDDFDALERTPGVTLRYVTGAETFGTPDLLILPGTKSTVADLAWLRESGLAERVSAHANGGGLMLGVCGGCQMLGGMIEDPHGVESATAVTEGLGLLPLTTRFVTEKRTHQVQARPAAPFLGVALGAKTVLTGYEIHMGHTSTTGTPAFTLTARSGNPVNVPDGAVNGRGNVAGTMIHGLLGNEALCAALVAHLRQRRGLAAREAAPAASDAYDRLADALEQHLDMAALDTLVPL